MARDRIRPSRRKVDVWRSIRAAALPTSAFLIVAFFAGFALFGSNGIMAWGDYAHKLETRRAELERLERQRAVLANRVKLVDPRRADPDMVDELVRNQLGVAHPDEVVVPLK